MTEIAFVTYAAGPEPTASDQLAVAALRDRGVTVTAVPWNNPSADWPAFDAVVVRSTWDYWAHPDAFPAWIDARGQDGTALWNPAPLLRWNLDKRYLRDLEAEGVPIVPTAWMEPGQSLRGILAERGWTRAVVKPRVSGGGFDTWTCDAHPTAEQEAEAARLAASPRGAMVQPFVPEIADPGEWSLVFLGGRFSHAVLKRPCEGEFRVQEQRGGSSQPAIAPRTLVDAAARVLEHVRHPWLYARVDGCVVDGTLLLMELEMLEPSLFLEQHAAAPQRFADAILAVAARSEAVFTR